MKKIEILEKKQDLIQKNYNDLLDLKKKRKTVNAKIKHLEKNLNNLIQTNFEEEPDLFNQFEKNE